MRKIFLAAAIGLMALSGAASGAATAESRRQEFTFVCLDPGGSNRGPICDRTLNAGADDFCRCPGNTDKVRIEVCQPGQVPPPQSASYEAFAHRASADGSLVGDDYNDQPVCARDTKFGRTR